VRITRRGYGVEREVVVLLVIDVVSFEGMESTVVLDLI
jgi:hypothetical protein